MNRRGTVRRTPFRLACLLLAALLSETTSAGESFAISNGTIAGGGGLGSIGCYVLLGTIGEPAVGTISNGEFTLTSGFPATVDRGNDNGSGEPVPTGDSIFGNGFEGTGDCAP